MDKKEILLKFNEDLQKGFQSLEILSKLSTEQELTSFINIVQKEIKVSWQKKQ